MQTAHSYGIIVGLALTLTAVVGCERLNPGWCEEHATCEVNEFCDPATNTCRAHDAGQPDLDQSLPDQARDLPLDLTPDLPIDGPSEGPSPDKAPSVDSAAESGPVEGGAG